MKNTSNHLGAYRNQSPATQFDLAFLLDMDTNAHVSRCEQGSRQANLELILTYHLVLNVPILSFFTNQREIVRKNLITRLPLLVHFLKQQKGPTSQKRIDYFESILTRLSEGKSDEQ